MADNQMTPIDIVTLVLAIWGSILSTVLAFREITRDRPRIKVVPEFATAFYDDLSERFTMLTIKVVNTGHRPITVTGMTFRLADGTHVSELRGWLFGIMTQYRNKPYFPETLDSPEPLVISLELAELADEFLRKSRDMELGRPTHVIVLDSIGKKHKAKIKKEEWERWLKETKRLKETD